MDAIGRSDPVFAPHLRYYCTTSNRKTNNSGWDVGVFKEEVKGKDLWGVSTTTDQTSGRSFQRSEFLQPQDICNNQKVQDKVRAQFEAWSPKMFCAIWLLVGH